MLKKLSNGRSATYLLIFFLVNVFLFFSNSNFSDKKQAPNHGDVQDKQKESFPIKKYSVGVFANETKYQSPFPMPSIEQPEFPDKICSIQEYGAVPDGKTLSTNAFREAIEDCANNGGGIVSVPVGKWLTGAIHLQNNINLHLSDGAEIIFSSSPVDYLPAVFSRYQGVEYYGLSPFIYANGVSNIAITGKGIIEGQGDLWWKKNDMNSTYALYEMARNDIPVNKRDLTKNGLFLRPSFIEFVNSDSILLEDFTIKDSPFWTIHPLYSKNIIIRGVNINTNGLNTDGIAIDSSSGVLVEDSKILSGDDAIVIKSGRDKDGLRVNKPSENIIVRGCKILEGHGGLSIGSETSGGVKNVFAYNIDMDKPEFAFRIKSSQGRGGVVENIWIEDVSVRKNEKNAIQIVTDYDAPFAPEYVEIPIFKNIHIKNFSSQKSKDGIRLLGFADKPLENVYLDNIVISYSGEGVSIEHVNNLEINRATISTLAANIYEIKDSQNIRIADSPCQKPTETICAKISGETCANISFTNTGINEKRIFLENSATKESYSIQ